MAKQVQVTLNNGVLSVNPQQLSCDRGNHQIEWTPGGNTDSFTFYSLNGLPNPPISAVSVTASKITATNDDSGAATYDYGVTVLGANNQYYTVGLSSVAGARPQAGGGAPQGTNRIQGGNNPTIKNN